MHWGSVFASDARVGVLIPPAVDPVSGQPELKCAPVRVRPYEPKWYGFALSRAPLELPATSYRAVARGAGYWRYELAGEDLPASWPEWADTVLGPRASRIELTDVAGGRYRGANVDGDPGVQWNAPADGEIEIAVPRTTHRVSRCIPEREDGCGAEHAGVEPAVRGALAAG